MASPARAGSGRRMPKEERQAQILRAAASVFAKARYAETTMDEVAAAAGVTRLILYRNFESKEHLYISVLDSVTARLVAEFADLPPRAGARRRLMAAQAALHLARQDHDGLTLLWRQARHEPGFAQHAERVRAAVVGRMHELLDQAYADLAMDARHRDWAAATATDYLFEAALNWTEHDTDDAAGAELIAAGLRGLIGGWRPAR